MSSVRAQIIAQVYGKLEGVRLALDWASLLRNPREPVGEDQANALVLVEGGDREPHGLTGHVGRGMLEFAVVLLVQESGGDTAEDLLDEGFVAVSDTLLDPNDIQLGGLAIAIERGAMSGPTIGRGINGARIVGGQSIEFRVEYLEREGDASTPGP